MEAGLQSRPCEVRSLGDLRKNFSESTSSAGRHCLLPTKGIAIMAISNLADLANNDALPIEGGGCAVCRELRRIPPDEAEGLRSLLRNKKLRYTEISDLIAADEDTPLNLTSDALGKHARGGCSAREKLR